MKKKIMLSIFFLVVLSLSVLVSAKECTDSDGGKNYDLKGIVNDLYCFTGPVYDNSGNYLGDEESCSQTYFNDYCGADRIYEGYCSDDSFVMETKICVNGCSDGACNEGPVQDVPTQGSCTDSDGGINYNQKGSLDIGGKKTWEDASIYDYCTDTLYPKDLKYPPIGGLSTSGKYLAEYSCSKSSFPIFGTDIEEIFAGEQYECPNGCSDGACLVQEEGEEITPSEDSEDLPEENFFQKIINWFKRLFGAD